LRTLRAAKTGISRGTARRYFEYLAGSGLIELMLRYGATGRPEHLYRYAFAENYEPARSDDDPIRVVPRLSAASPRAVSSTLDARIRTSPSLSASSQMGRRGQLVRHASIVSR
jgi:predicted ArsR family transcriptional regulator